MTPFLEKHFDIIFPFIPCFQMTESAVKDYNRGRHYLSDLAKRQDVPVFSDLKEAVKCAIEKVKLFKSRSNV